MIKSKKALIAALLFPILALAALTDYKRSVLTFGTEVTLPITGYDPRDLLAGHYLIYQVDYGVNGICQGTYAEKKIGFICLDEPKQFSFTRPEPCRNLIRGVCNFSRFEAGIERYYVPQERALELEQKVRSKSASIVLSLPSSGQAQVKDLLIDGKPWQSK